MRVKETMCAWTATILPILIVIMVITMPASTAVPQRHGGTAVGPVSVETSSPGVLWALERIEAPLAWTVTTGSDSVTVAIIGNGIPLNHKAFAGLRWRNTAEINGTAGVDDDGNGFVDDIDGIGEPFQLVSGELLKAASPDSSDRIGTGHSVAIMANTGDMEDEQYGLLRAVRLLPIRLWQSGTAASRNNFSRSIQYARDAGASILLIDNLQPGWLDAQIFAAIAEFPGLVVIAADLIIAEPFIAGLDNPRAVLPGNLLIVAESGPDDLLWGLHSNIATLFRSRGKDLIHLAAPSGVDEKFAGTNCIPVNSRSSAAYVAGTGVLLKAAYGWMTGEMLAQRILDSCDPLPGLDRFTIHGGRLNAGRALTGRSDTGIFLPGKWTMVDKNPTLSREAMGMAYDSGSGSLVIAGGYAYSAKFNRIGYRDDTWIRKNGEWRYQNSAIFTTNYGAMFCYDSSRGRVLAYGGEEQQEGTYTPLWPNLLREFDGSVWQTLDATGPEGRGEHCFAYDSKRGVAVLFGGARWSDRGYSDTWEFDGDTWRLIGTGGPRARAGAAMAFDEQRGVMVLFGGYDGRHRLNDTWEYDGTRWNRIKTRHAPHPVDSHAMSFDPRRKNIVMFGGYALRRGCSVTWEYDGVDWRIVTFGGPQEEASAHMVFDNWERSVLLLGGYPVKSEKRVYARGLWAYHPVGRSAFVDTIAAARSVDLNADGRPDRAVWRPSTGEWLVDGNVIARVGGRGDTPVLLDRDGDSHPEFGVFRRTSGEWIFSNGEKKTFGRAGDIPVPGDYDGDGSDDLAVYRPSMGTYLIFGEKPLDFATATDIPAPADYDGDGAWEAATCSPQDHMWRWRDRSIRLKESIGGGIPAPADYDGDGSAEPALYFPHTGAWVTYNAKTGERDTYWFGFPKNCIAVPVDISGDNRADMILFDPLTGKWWDGAMLLGSDGGMGDIPRIR